MSRVEQNEIDRALIEVEHQHAAIGEQIDEWREWWRELSEIGQPHFGEMGDRLSRFRDTLAAHFRHEEFRGPMAKLIQAAEADQAERIRAFWKEHGEMLSELDELIKHLACCNGEICCWGDARDRFEAFLDRLQGHDREEHFLLDEMIPQH